MKRMKKQQLEASLASHRRTIQVETQERQKPYQILTPTPNPVEIFAAKAALFYAELSIFW